MTYKILVAEDDPALLDSIRIRLASDGYEVLCSHDAYQAVAMVSQMQPDMLILDIHMPAGDGFSVQDRIRRMPHVGTIPILYMTGDRSRQMLAKVRDIGALSLLRKPFDSLELLQVVRQTLEETESRLDSLGVG
jgi:DNA-binding response OmpR family regulator